MPEPLFNKFAGQRPATLLIKRLWQRLWHVSCGFCIILNKTLFQNTPRWVLVINGLQSIKTKQHRGVFYKKATSKSWTRTLKNLGSENLDPEKPGVWKPGPWKTLTQKNLDPKALGSEKHGPWKPGPQKSWETAGCWKMIRRLHGIIY